MESLRKISRKAALLFLCLFLAAALVPKAQAAVTYTMKGAFNEDGTFNDSGINVTMTRQTESPITFFLNGTYLANATTKAVVFSFDLGYNESRTYYTLNGTAETIYVLLPQEPYYTYFFEVVDYVGLSWGYLESCLNVNGTDTVVERWSLNVMNEMPFTLSWGKAYSMRLVCNKGTYVYGSYVAGATTSFTLAVTSDMFPITPTDINGLSVSALRENETWIQCYYNDIYSETDWVNFDIIEYGETTPTYSFNTSSQTVTLNWLEAASDTDYYVLITINHTLLGTKVWSFPCPAPVTASNPFDVLSYLGDFPIAANQVPAVFLLIAVGLCFSWLSIIVGMISEVIVAALLVWMGWLAIGWTWLTLAGSIIVLLALVEAKQREITTS